MTGTLERIRRKARVRWVQHSAAGLALLTTLCTFAYPPVFGAEAAKDESNIPGVPWPATDALGRRVPTEEEVGPPRQGRFVGIFYFLWHNNPGGGKPAGGKPDGGGPYDVSKILARDPAAGTKPDSPLWGPRGAYHYWAEPLYGYYLGTDPWVLRRHARLLADAGVDTLIFDATNARSYPDVYLKLCEVFDAVRKAGGRTPRVAFMVNTKAADTAEQIYKEFYQPGLHRDLWFQWQGKPLMLCEAKQATPEVRQFFTLRAAHWPFDLVNTPYAWHWEATYPQPYGYTDNPAKPEEVNVSVAQNLRARDGKVTNMSAGDARGRGFHDGKADHSPAAIAAGLNFQEQWKRALDLKPPFVMVTGWNEWIAGRFGRKGEPVTFVDQYDEEFSRDIEPMKGGPARGHADNYYYQLVSNVRRYKGALAVPRGSAPKSIRIDGGFEQWKDVGPEYADDAGDTQPRDWPGAGGLHYADRTGRNDLVAFKVARDEKNVYFYARTREPLTPHTDANWMWLLIDADRDSRTGWEGYDYVLNRTVEGDNTTWLEKNDGGWKWKKVTLVHYRAAGNELQLAVPRSALGYAEGGGGVSFDFKWADNLQHPGDVSDFYVSGDVAPEGRFAYRYVGK